MIKLKDFSTNPPKGVTKEEIVPKTIKIVKEIEKYQEKLIAEGKQALLVVLQGMDSSGKDGAAQAVFQNCSPNGVSAHSFKKPSDVEFAHDFLWRCHKIAPQKGHIEIFIRSHYEDILIQRVHKWIDEKRVKMRMNAINAWEHLLLKDNNTRVLKFYMNLSKDRQKEKLQERIDIPTKNWKHNPADWDERKHWDEYMKCYEYIFNKSEIPWIIAPVDKRWYRNYFIAKKVLETLKEMNPTYPILDKK